MLPFELPPEGPNYYTLDDSARYGIHVDKNGDGRPEIGYHVRTRTQYRTPGTFLYHTGVVDSPWDPDLHVYKSFRLFRSLNGGNRSW